jgi:hypothetical protein
VANSTTLIHVTGSTSNFSEDRPFLEAIFDTIYVNKAEAAHNWLDAAASRLKQSSDSDVDWQAVHNSNLTSIKRSDLVIVEATQLNFAQGLLAYTADQYKKPTLVLSRTPTTNRFISGTQSKYIAVKEYTNEDELRTIVTKFIKQNSIPEKDLRFNMVLDRPIYRYLRDTSYETGKNKSQIVRELLERDLKRRNGPL